MPEARALSDVVQENHRLRQRVFELEEQLARRPGPPPDSAPPLDERVFQLLRKKDATLGDSAYELEEKNEKLEEAVTAMRKHNIELTHWLTALRLFQDIFENDPAVLIGFDPDRNIIHYNHAADVCFGEQIRSSILNDILTLPLEGKLGTGVTALIESALRTRTTQELTLESGGETVHVKIFQLTGEDGLRGGILSVSRLPIV